MLIEREPDGTIRILAPAKVNLFLEVLGRRSDGFHEIETVLCPVSLFDELTFSLRQDPEIELEISLPKDVSWSEDASAELKGDEVAWQIPCGQDNLVHKAARAVQQRLGCKHGANIRLRKQIPASAGLGGGSSDAAAAVVAGLLAWNQWDRQLANKICSQIGSDVPFFLGSESQIGLAKASGRGEKCEAIPAQPALEMIITHPPVGCSTAEIYALCRPTAAPKQAQEIITACESGQFQKIGAALFNALQSPASQTTDWIDRQLSIFATHGAAFALMSGSGSSCFALLEHAESGKSICASAARTGIRRVYQVASWYGDAIERQIAQGGITQ